MRALEGPSIFLAQFQGDQPPFDTLDALAAWAASLGYAGVQIPCDPRLIDLERAAESRDYCDELNGRPAERGIVATELSTHLQGQLFAVHPASEALFAGFAPAELCEDSAGRRAWAERQLRLPARASANLGLAASTTFSGALAWPYVYPSPQRSAGLADEAFAELGRRWTPVLDAYDAAGVDLAYEIHPGENLHDGITFERFLAVTGDHPRANILYDPSLLLMHQLNDLDFIDIYHERIRCFHGKDAEFRPSGRAGVYGGYADWIDRPGRYRSLGDSRIDFTAISSKMAQYDYAGWAVVEWECAIKHPEDGAREGAAFVRDHIIRVTDRAFDDFAGNADPTLARRVLGL